MKNKIIISLVIFLVSALTFAFIVNINRVFNSDGPVSTQTANSINTANSPEVEILGVWFMEGDASNKIEFTADGHVKIYVDNILEADDIYLITDNCEGVPDGGGSRILQIIDSEDGTVNCSLINGINENDSNILSLLESNGQLTVYNR